VVSVTAVKHDAGNIAGVDADRVLKAEKGIGQIVCCDSFGYQLFGYLAKSRHDDLVRLARSSRSECSFEPSLRESFTGIEVFELLDRGIGANYGRRRHLGGAASATVHGQPGNWVDFR